LYLSSFISTVGLNGMVLLDSSENSLAGDGVSSPASSGSGIASVRAGGTLSKEVVQAETLNKSRFSLDAVAYSTASIAQEVPSRS
jgi:hypothetical protein